MRLTIAPKGAKPTENLGPDDQPSQQLPFSHDEPLPIPQEVRTAMRTDALVLSGAAFGLDELSAGLAAWDFEAPDDSMPRHELALSQLGAEHPDVIVSFYLLPALLVVARDRKLARDGDAFLTLA